MKNFDIEKLERKNVYQTPPDFFAEVQEKVLQETVYKIPVAEKKTKIFSINKVYVAAACVILFLGIVGIMRLNDERIQPVEKNLIANQTDSASEKEVINEKTDYQVIVEDIKNAEGEQQNVAPAKALAVTKQKSASRLAVQSLKSVSEPSKIEKYDQIMVELSSADYADLNRSEQDVYLDLYN
ncbi:MAG: hypothetical protein QM564_05165 [Bergeyella sp.]